MSVQGIIQWTVDINKPHKQFCLGPMFQGDQNQLKISLHILQDGQPISLTGASVTAYLMRSDKTTVVWSGSVSSNIASVVLTQHAHTIPGRVQLAIRVTIGSVKHTVFAAEGNVHNTTTDTVIDPTGVIPTLDDLLAQIAAMEAVTAAANAAVTRVNTAIDGIPDAIEEAVEPIKEIYGSFRTGNILADWPISENYYVNASGATSGTPNYFCYQHVPVMEGVTYYCSSEYDGTSRLVTFYDSNGVNLNADVTYAKTFVAPEGAVNATLNFHYLTDGSHGSPEMYDNPQKKKSLGPNWVVTQENNDGTYATKAEVEDIAVQLSPVLMTSETPTTEGYLDWNTGVYVDSPRGVQHTTDYTEIKRGIAYTIKCRYRSPAGEESDDIRAVFVYNADKTMSRKLTYTDYTRGFVPVGSEKYVRVNWMGTLISLIMYETGRGKDSYTQIVADLPELSIKDSAYIHARRPLIAFVLDGDWPLNDEFEAIFDEHGVRIGFAPTYDTSFPHVSLKTYLDWQRKGHEIMVHGKVDVGNSSSLTPDQIRKSIKDAYTIMTGYGFKIHGYVSLAGNTSESYIPDIKRLFDYGMTAPNHASIWSGKESSCHYFGEGDTYHLWRYSIQDSPLEKAKEAVDTAINTGGLLLFYGHARADLPDSYLTAENINALLTYIETKDIEVKTPYQSIKDFYSIRYDDIFKT